MKSVIDSYEGCNLMGYGDLRGLGVILGSWEKLWSFEVLLCVMCM